MKVSQNGLDFLRAQEGFSATIYNDVGRPAIGFGCDLNPWEVAKYRGRAITFEEATDLMLQRLAPMEETIAWQVRVPITQNQFDALASFTYNLGPGRFKRSTLLKKLNLKDYKGAAEEFLAWDMVNGKHDPSAYARRKREKHLFES